MCTCVWLVSIDYSNPLTNADASAFAGKIRQTRFLVRVCVCVCVCLLCAFRRQRRQNTALFFFCVVCVCESFDNNLSVETPCSRRLFACMSKTEEMISDMLLYDSSHRSDTKDIP